MALAVSAYLKQLLFILTVTADGGVPLQFRAASGNVTDDQTHRQTWDLLEAYKRQPTIEKRFSQLKTDFEEAPVYLKSVHRIQAMLCVYFFALLVEALLERQLRHAMQDKEIESLPLYPEGRRCRWPTARRVIDLFETVQRHVLERRGQPSEIMVTELSRLKRRLIKLLGLPVQDYGR
jgi:transposase